LVLTVVAVLAVSEGAAVADVYFVCYRCNQPDLLYRHATHVGTNRAVHLLCKNCGDPARRCGEALEELQKRINKLRKGTADQHAEVAELLREEHPDALFLEALQAAIRGAEAELARLERLLQRLQQECAAEGASALGNAFNPGGIGAPPGGSNVGRDAPTRPGSTGGTTGSRATSGDAAPSPGPATPRSLDQQLRDRQARMQRLTTAGAGQVAVPLKTPGAPPNGAYLYAVHRYIGPMVEVARPPALEAGLPGAPGGASDGEVVLSPEAAEPGNNLVEPRLVEVFGDLPKRPIEDQFTRLQRRNANALAYGEALAQTEAQALAAREQGDDKRALELANHALYLATMGQQELREGEEEWLSALRVLYEDGWYFQNRIRGQKLTPAQAFAQWQSQVRTDGLPAEYVAGLPQAGLTDEQIAQHRDELLAVKPEEAARAHYDFMQLAEPLRYAKPAPAEDTEWDIASVRLLHLRAQLDTAATQPAP
jgi:hypothetical protein